MIGGMKRKYLRNLISLPLNTALLCFVCSLWCPGSPFMHRKTWQNTWLPLHWILLPCVFNISLWSDSSRADLNTSLYGDQYVFIHTVIILFILMLEHWSLAESQRTHTFFSHLDISDYADIQILNKLLMSFPTFFPLPKSRFLSLWEKQKSLNEKTHMTAVYRIEAHFSAKGNCQSCVGSLGREEKAGEPRGWKYFNHTSDVYLCAWIL